LLVLAACGKGGAPAAAAALPIHVFAAASLTAPFTDIAKAFEAAQPGTKVELNTAGTPLLLQQIRENATADVLATADQTSMQKIVDAGTTAAAPVEFARNRLAIVVAPGNPRQVQNLADLARRDLKVALCGPDVPAGKYARQALAKARVQVASLSDEPSVKALVSKVQLGELDAGVVYATDTRAQGVSGVPIADELNVVASYPIAVLKVGRNAAGGEAFAAFVRGERGRAILAEHGFVLP
jgi:molybdate transport system substrate-binding protein